MGTKETIWQVTKRIYDYAEYHNGDMNAKQAVTSLFKTKDDAEKAFSNQLQNKPMRGVTYDITLYVNEDVDVEFTDEDGDENPCWGDEVNERQLFQKDIKSECVEAEYESLNKDFSIILVWYWEKFVGYSRGFQEVRLPNPSVWGVKAEEKTCDILTCGIDSTFEVINTLLLDNREIEECEGDKRYMCDKAFDNFLSMGLWSNVNTDRVYWDIEELLGIGHAFDDERP